MWGEKRAPEVCVMCGVHLGKTDIRKHLGLHILDAALAIIERPIGVHLDNMDLQIPATLGYAAPALNSNLGRGSGAEGFYDTFSSEVLAGALSVIDGGKTYTHDKAEVSDDDGSYTSTDLEALSGSAELYLYPPFAVKGIALINENQDAISRNLLSDNCKEPCSPSNSPDASALGDPLSEDLAS